VRSASASLVLVAIAVALAACSATSPRPLPPHHHIVDTTAPPPPPRPADLPIPAAPPFVHERYAGSMLLADAVSIVPLVTWMTDPDRLYLAAPALVLPPLVHALHGETDKAIGSLLMRAALLAIVYGAGESGRDSCAEPNALLCVPIAQIMIASAATSAVIITDACLLGRRRRPDPGWGYLRVLPTAGPTPSGGGMFGLAGRF
jgi:hypothetical protein